MAELKSIAPSVQASEKVLWGCMAEAQCLIQLMTETDDESPLLRISSGVVERFVNAFDLYHVELLRHGVASLEERYGEDIQ